MPAHARASGMTLRETGPYPGPNGAVSKHCVAYA